jgi:hypothetical protein
VADCDRDEADAKGDAVVISTSPLPGCNKALTLGSWYLASLTIAIFMITGTGVSSPLGLQTIPWTQRV